MQLIVDIARMLGIERKIIIIKYKTINNPKSINKITRLFHLNVQPSYPYIIVNNLIINCSSGWKKKHPDWGCAFALSLGIMKLKLHE